MSTTILPRPESRHPPATDSGWITLRVSSGWNLTVEDCEPKPFPDPVLLDESVDDDSDQYQVSPSFIHWDFNDMKGKTRFDQQEIFPSRPSIIYQFESNFDERIRLTDSRIDRAATEVSPFSTMMACLAHMAAGGIASPDNERLAIALPNYSPADDDGNAAKLLNKIDGAVSFGSSLAGVPARKKGDAKYQVWIPRPIVRTEAAIWKGRRGAYIPMQTSLRTPPIHLETLRLVVHGETLPPSLKLYAGLMKKAKLFIKVQDRRIRGKFLNFTGIHL